MNMEFKANIIWETQYGKPLSPIMDKLCEVITHCLFLPLYNEIVDDLNGRYEAWNKEYFSEHPDEDGYSRGYNLFIAKKSNEIIGDRHRQGMTIRAELIEDDMMELIGHWQDLRCKIRIKQA